MTHCYRTQHNTGQSSSVSRVNECPELLSSQNEKRFFSFVFACDSDRPKFRNPYWNWNCLQMKRRSAATHEWIRGRNYESIFPLYTVHGIPNRRHNHNECLLRNAKYAFNYCEPIFFSFAALLATYFHSKIYCNVWTNNFYYIIFIFHFFLSFFLSTSRILHTHFFLLHFSFLDHFFRFLSMCMCVCVFKAQQNWQKPCWGAQMSEWDGAFWL